MHNRYSTILGWLAVAGFFLTAAGHASAFGDFSNDPALWYVFSFQQVVLGSIAALLAQRVIAGGRVILLIAALAPLGECALMFKYLGPIVPSFCVLTSGVLPLAAALAYPKATPAAAAPRAVPKPLPAAIGSRST